MSETWHEAHDNIKTEQSILDSGEKGRKGDDFPTIYMGFVLRGCIRLDRKGFGLVVISHAQA